MLLFHLEQGKQPSDKFYAIVKEEIIIIEKSLANFPRCDADGGTEAPLIVETNLLCFTT